MAPRKRKSNKQPPNTAFGKYWEQTQRPLNALLFVLPLMLAYEIGVATRGSDLLSRNQIGQFLQALGASKPFLPALLVVVVLLIAHVAAGDKWQLNGWAALGMAFEAIAWALPLLGLGILSQRMIAGGITLGGIDQAAGLNDLLACLGAALYEEFLFRLMALNLLTLLLLDVLEAPKDIGYAVSIVVSSALFGLYHFWGRWSDLTGGSLAFYWLAGAYLSGVYIIRGFGLSVGAHALYNLMALSLRLTWPGS